MDLETLQKVEEMVHQIQKGLPDAERQVKETLKFPKQKTNQNKTKTQKHKNTKTQNTKHKTKQTTKNTKKRNQKNITI